MQKTLEEIAKFVDGVIVGDPKTVIANVSGIKEAKAGDIAFVANSKYFSLIEKTSASAVIVPKDMNIEGFLGIKVDNSSLAFAKVASLFAGDVTVSFAGIHETAVIDEDVKVAKDVAIGPYVIIEKGVRIDSGTVIYGGCFIGSNTVIGKDCLIYPNVTIRERIIIGSKVVIHSGTVVGSDGFGFVNVEGVHEKIPQIGTVEICDDVEIGANVTIDRARFDKTVVGRGTKIDNLVQIAHNVRIGENCIIISQVGISGSNIIENNVILAGQAGLAGHLTIGEGAVVASQAGVTNSVAPHTTVSGYPAKLHSHAKRVNACVQRLPGYIKIINELKKRVEDLEKQLGSK